MKQRVIRKRDHDDDVDEGKEVVTAKPTIKNSKITTKPKLTVGLSFDDDNDLNQGGGFQIKKSKLSQAVIINHFDSSELVKEESLGGMYSKESLDLLKKSQLFTTINNNESNDNEVANHDENEYKNQMNIDLVDQVDQFDSSPMNSHSINQNTHNQNTQEYEIVLSGEDAEKLEEIEEMEQRDKGITINTNSAMNQDFIPFRTNKYLSDTNMDDMNQTERDIEMDQEMKNAKLRMKADITKSSLKSDRIFMSTSGGEKGKSKGSVRFATTDDNNSHSSMLEVDVQWENQITQRAGLGLTSTHRPLLRSDYDNEGSTIANITSTTTATATTSYMKHSSTVGSHSKGFDFHQIKSTLSQALSSFTESTNALSQKSSRLEQERELLYKQKIVLQRKVEVGEPVFRYMQVSIYIDL